MNNDSKIQPNDPADRTWQSNMLPLMSRMLVFLAVFFFVATCAQLYFLHREIQAERGQNLDEVLTMLPANGHYQDPVAAADLKARIVLEEQSIRRHYHQANILLMSRTWVRYIGFVTGMILAFVGAAFILGKLSTPENTLESTIPQGRLVLRSHSPGLILAGMGCLLILTTVMVNHQISTHHNSIYMRPMPDMAPSAVTETKTPDLPDILPVRTDSALPVQDTGRLALPDLK